MSAEKVRVTVDVTPPEHRRLREAQLDDNITHQKRLRALVQLWASDPQLQLQVAKVVEAMTEPNRGRPRRKVQLSEQTEPVNEEQAA